MGIGRILALCEIRALLKGEMSPQTAYSSDTLELVAIIATVLSSLVTVAVMLVVQKMNSARAEAIAEKGWERDLQREKGSLLRVTAVRFEDDDVPWGEPFALCLTITNSGTYEATLNSWGVELKRTRRSMLPTFFDPSSMSWRMRKVYWRQMVRGTSLESGDKMDEVVPAHSAREVKIRLEGRWRNNLFDAVGEGGFWLVATRDWVARPPEAQYDTMEKKLKPEARLWIKYIDNLGSKDKVLELTRDNQPRVPVIR